MTTEISPEIKKNKRKIFFFLLYRALSIDYFFLYAVDTVYYSEVKGMTFSQISLIATILCLSYVIIAIPFVSIVRKIGTVRSSQLGTLFYFISAVMVFFDPIVIYISQFFFAVGIALKGPSESKILKDNLKMYGLSEKYSKYTSLVQFSYAVIEGVATLLAGFLFDFWPYTPVVLCSLFLAIACILSFFIKNEKELYKKQNNLPMHNVKTEKFEFFKLFKYHTTWLLLIFSAIFFALTVSSLDINKMVFKDLAFSTVTITIVWGVAKILRGITAFGFGLIYKKLGFKSIYIIIVAIIGGLSLIGFGGVFASGTVALILLSIGTVLIICTKEPFSLVREDFVMNSNGLSKRQTLLQITNLGCYIGRLIASFSISYILLSQSPAMVNLILLGALVPLAIIFSLLLQRKRKINKYDVYY